VCIGKPRKAAIQWYVVWTFIRKFPGIDMAGGDSGDSAEGDSAGGDSADLAGGGSAGSDSAGFQSA
jgi:hypothetical protein